MNFEELNWNMNLAREEANKAFGQDEVPVGAVIIGPDGKLLASQHNLKEQLKDPTAHAEIYAIREASKNLDNWRLEGCSIFVTLEPCPMCLHALMQARIKNLYFGAYDKKGGSLSLGYNFHKDSKLNHTFNVTGGLKHKECSELLSTFFKQKRR